MSLPALIAIGLGFALTAYAILAGADFGAGILDLTSGHSVGCGITRIEFSRDSSESVNQSRTSMANGLILIFPTTESFSQALLNLTWSS